MRKLNVLMFGPHPDATGGISTVVSNWMEAGIENNINLDYISTIDDVAPGYYFRKILNAIKAYFIFIKKKRKDIDLVHIHMSHGMSFYRKLIIFMISKIKGIKVIIHLHGSKFVEFYENGSTIQKKLISYLFDHADSVIALSVAWKDFIEKISTNSNIYIIYNGASLSKFEHKIDNGGEIYISFMGRLGERKGTYDLLVAFKKLSSEFPQVHLLLGGDGDINKVKQIVEDEKLSSLVHVIGWVSGTEKIDVFSKTDIYVLPSYNEGLPGSILEAMAAGAPIVSTTVGGIPEAVIDGKNGLLIQAGDIDSLHNALSTLCSDKSLRENMGMESKKLIATKFNIKDIVTQVQSVYNDMTNRK